MISEVISAIKTPIKTSPLGESVIRVDHYVDDDISQGEIVREIFMEDLEPKDKVRVICGEFSGNTFKFINDALEKNVSVEIISGKDHRITEDVDIDNLLNTYPDTFSYYELDFRPSYHGALIGKNMFFEEPHPDDIPYETALAVKNAWKETIDDFNSLFDSYKKLANKYQRQT